MSLNAALLWMKCLKALTWYWQVPDFGSQSFYTGHNFPNIGTFAVPLLTYVLMETHIKGVISYALSGY